MKRAIIWSVIAATIGWAHSLNQDEQKVHQMANEEKSQCAELGQSCGRQWVQVVGYYTHTHIHYQRPRSSSLRDRAPYT